MTNIHGWLKITNGFEWRYTSYGSDKMKSPYSRIPFLKWDGNVVLWDGNVILCTLGRGHIMVIEWWFKIVNCKSLRGT